MEMRQRIKRSEVSVGVEREAQKGVVSDTVVIKRRKDVDNWCSPGGLIDLTGSPISAGEEVSEKGVVEREKGVVVKEKKEKRERKERRVNRGKEKREKVKSKETARRREVSEKKEGVKRNIKKNSEKETTKEKNAKEREKNATEKNATEKEKETAKIIPTLPIVTTSRRVTARYLEECARWDRRLEKEEEKAEALRRRREEMRRKREEMKAHNVLMHDLALVSKQEEKDKVKTQVATAPS